MVPFLLSSIQYRHLFDCELPSTRKDSIGHAISLDSGVTSLSTLLRNGGRLPPPARHRH